MAYKRIKIKRIRNEFAECHPLVGVTYIASVLIVTMSTMNIGLLAVSYIMAFICSVIFKGINKALKDIAFELPLLIFTAVIQPIFSGSGTTELYYINDNAVTLEAYVYGVAAGLMLISAVRWCSLIRVVLGGDKTMYLFAKITPTLGLTFSMIMRFIPLLKQRYEQIHSAQLGMGRNVASMGMFARAALYVKEISILISWSLENSIETSASMEARGYGLKRRTSYHTYVITVRDIIVIIYILVLFVCIMAGLLSGAATVYYLPVIYFAGNKAGVVVMAVMFTALSGVPFFHCSKL